MDLMIRVAREDGRSLQAQIYEAVRGLILSGALPAGRRLPSTRALSEQLGIARNTVSLAYERLAAEDYLTSRIKAGTFVNATLPDTTALISGTSPARVRAGRRVRLGSNPSFSARAPDLWRSAQPPRFDFLVGRPRPASFPATFWRQAINRHLAHSRATPTEYGDPCGLYALRTAIADHLRDVRGIEAVPDQIVVTSGIQGALNLLARIFLTGARKPSVAVENPCYQGAAFLFGSYGASIAPIDVDDQGLMVSRLEQYAGSLVYVTPSHQFPTGCTLSLERRLHLLDWADQTGSYIIEDDYDGDFRYDGPPLTALAGLDRRGRVIYLGTFSKSIGAGLRLGYAVLPRHLLDQARIAKTLLDHGAPWLEQAVLADFIRDGAFLRHLRRIRRSYKASRDALVAAVDRHFPGSSLMGRECGMHMLWLPPSSLPLAADMQSVARRHDVGLYGFTSGAAYEYGAPGRYRDRALILGYAALSADEIDSAFLKLSAAIGGAPGGA